MWRPPICAYLAIAISRLPHRCGNHRYVRTCLWQYPVYRMDVETTDRCVLTHGDIPFTAWMWKPPIGAYLPMAISRLPHGCGNHRYVRTYPWRYPVYRIDAETTDMCVLTHSDIPFTAWMWKLPIGACLPIAISRLPHRC
jgi:hypothetical protein